MKNTLFPKFVIFLELERTKNLHPTCSEKSQIFKLKIFFKKVSKNIEPKCCTYFFLVGSGSSDLFGLLHCLFAIRPWRFETESEFESFWLSASLKASNSIFILYASWFTFTKIRYQKTIGEIVGHFRSFTSTRANTIHKSSIFQVHPFFCHLLIRRVVHMRIFYLKSRKSRVHPFWPSS